MTIGKKCAALLCACLLTLPVASAEPADSVPIAASSLEEAQLRQPGKLYAADLNADGSVETLRVYAETGELGKNLCLAVYGPDGAQLGEAELLATAFPPEYDEIYHTMLELYRLDDGRLYVEARLLFEGISTDYMIFELGAEGLTLSRHIADPGYSSGFGLTDPATGEELCFREGDGWEELGIATLNEAFQEDGLSFAMKALSLGGYEASRCAAVLPESSRLCSLYDLEKETLFAVAGAETVGAGDSWFFSTDATGDAAQTPAPTKEPQPTEAPKPTRAPDDGVRRVTATGNVNVRTGPNRSYESLGVLDKGRSAAYLGRQEADERGVIWYEIEFGGQSGWISSVYSRLGGESAPTGGNQTPVETAPDGDIRITGGKANLRKGPGLGYDVICSMKEGRVIEYLGETSTDDRGVNWYRVDFNGSVGWVSSKYARFID